MSDPAARANLLDFPREELERFFLDRGEKRFRAEQLMKWVYHRDVTDFSQMTDIGKDLRAKIADWLEIRPPRVVTEQRSEDGTRKWLLALEGGNAVETVFIPESDRGTLCVSSQVGCTLNCTFCSTATQGFNRNLSIAEIFGQVYRAGLELGHTPNNRRITNVVMMGMGEPLMNFENVVGAMSLMCDDLAFGLAGKRVTLSTAGVVPQIDALRERIDVSLAVSLHAAEDELRSQLVPLNRKYPIDALMAACRRYVAGTRNRVTFEYTLIDGVNDSEAHARRLVKLLRTVPSKLNLIPFNPFPGTRYQCSPPEAIERFQRIIMDAKIVATLRRTRGDDIDAACGQLVGRVQDRTRRQERHRARLESLGVLQEATS
ncbi:MAG: 23S rRNA (adenine(2503)-C(2))-methyltransferase RlmN [Xanthomonadales bacterium]|nr:23S rRNA (adenine(2503)-C(2))-methyltransferase RlmN [Xanthomonadales bacterium]